MALVQVRISDMHTTNEETPAGPSLFAVMRTGEL